MTVAELERILMEVDGDTEIIVRDGQTGEEGPVTGVWRNGDDGRMYVEAAYVA